MVLDFFPDISLTDVVIVRRQEPDLGDLHLSLVPIVQEDLEHASAPAVRPPDLELLHGPGEQAVVGLAPEDANPGPDGHLMLALRLYLQDLSRKNEPEFSTNLFLPIHTSHASDHSPIP